MTTGPGYRLTRGGSDRRTPKRRPHVATITSPVKGFNGSIVGVAFTDGVAESTIEGALLYFDRKGYTIDRGETADKPVAKMNKDELVAYAAEHGIELGDADTKKDIAAAVTAVVTSE